MRRPRGWISRTCVICLLAACTPAPTATSIPTAAASITASAAAPTSSSPSSALNTPQPGGLVVQEIAQENGFSLARWAPDGRAFAVTVGQRQPTSGSAEVFAADGSKLATIAGASDVAWLDASTLAVFAMSPTVAFGSVIVHSLAGTAEMVASSTSGGIVGSGTSRIAILDPYTQTTPARFRVFGSSAASTPADASWFSADEIEGSPVVWSSDASLLAVFVDISTAAASGLIARTVSVRRDPFSGAAKLAAASSMSARLVVRRYPGDTIVPTPNDIFQGPAEWSFSPDDRFVVGGGVTQATGIVDLRSGRLTELPLGHAGWTPDGNLVLVRDNGSAALWHPDGSITETGLPAGTPTFGPRPDEAFVTPPYAQGIAGNALVQIGGRSAAIPLLPYAPFASATWAPDGSACFVATGGDNAQLADATLYRVSLP